MSNNTNDPVILNTIDMFREAMADRNPTLGGALDLPSDRRPPRHGDAASGGVQATPCPRCGAMTVWNPPGHDKLNSGTMVHMATGSRRCELGPVERNK